MATPTPEQIHKELDLVQDVIKRMAANSFEVKKWLIGILSAIIVFKHEELMGGDKYMVWLLLLPVVSFWYLDAFFLSAEKLYREMYHWLVINRPTTTDYLYDLNTFTRQNNGQTTNFAKPEHKPIHVMFSKTLLPFYIVPFLFIVVYGLILLFKPVATCCYCH